MEYKTEEWKGLQGLCQEWSVGVVRCVQYTAEWNRIAFEFDSLVLVICEKEKKQINKAYQRQGFFFDFDTDRFMVYQCVRTAGLSWSAPKPRAAFSSTIP